MIDVLPLRFRFTPDRTLRLGDNPGALWRSAIGAQLRRQACLTGAPQCAGCALIDRCAYGYLYETPPPDGTSDLAAYYRTPPHPYVLSPSCSNKTYRPGDALALDVTLITPAERFLPELLRTLHAPVLGNAQLSLVGLDVQAPLPERAGTTHGLTAAMAHALRLAPQRPVPPASPSTARLCFERPLRLRYRNRYIGPEDFSFGIFFTALMRRIRMLSALSGRVPDEHSPRALADNANAVTWRARSLAWHDGSRRSARQGRSIPMGGVVGDIEITGDLSLIWPWLWIGQWLHAGKSAVMGHGRYRIETAGT